MRLQLAGPNLHLLTPEQYNQLFSMHGMTMIFLYASPVLSGFSNYLWPLLLGAATWPFRASTRSATGSTLRRAVPVCRLRDRHRPERRLVQLRALRRAPYNPGSNMDFYSLGMIFLGISTTVGAANFIVTRSCAPARRACRSTGCRS